MTEAPNDTKIQRRVISTLPAGHLFLSSSNTIFQNNAHFCPTLTLIYKFRSCRNRAFASAAIHEEPFPLPMGNLCYPSIFQITSSTRAAFVSSAVITKNECSTIFKHSTPFSEKLDSPYFINTQFW